MLSAHTNSLYHYTLGHHWQSVLHWWSESGRW